MGHYRDCYDFMYDETYERVSNYIVIVTYANGEVDKWNEDEANCLIKQIEKVPEDFTDDGVVKVEIIEELEEIGVVYKYRDYEYEEYDEYVDDTREYTIYTKEF